MQTRHAAGYSAIIGGSRLDAAPLLGFSDRRINGIELAVAAALHCNPHSPWRAIDKLALDMRFEQVREIKA